MGSEGFTTSVSKDLKYLLEYLEDDLVPIYGTKSAANMETLRFHKEQHKEPLGDKIDKLIASNEKLIASNERLARQIEMMEKKLI